MIRDWALVVGINHYPSAGVQELEGAVHDAEEFYTWVTDPKGGDVDEKHAKILKTNDGPDKSRPKMQQIEDFFDELMDAPTDQVGRRLYLYLSGHGIAPATQTALRNFALPGTADYGILAMFDRVLTSRARTASGPSADPLSLSGLVTQLGLPAERIKTATAGLLIKIFAMRGERLSFSEDEKRLFETTVLCLLKSGKPQ